MTAAMLRKALRWAHIFASLLIGTYLYSPWSSEPLFQVLVLYAVFPFMAASGLLMWHQGRIARLLRRGK